MTYTWNMTAVNVIKANNNDEYLKYTQSGLPKLKLFSYRIWLLM